MRRFILSFALIAALPHAVFAEDGATEKPEPSESDGGSGLMEQGLRLFMQGILTEMEPALDDLRSMAEDMEPAIRNLMDAMGPAFVTLFRQVDDFANYEPPVFLPNGDIIMRRKPDAPVWVPPEGAEIDL